MNPELREKIRDLLIIEGFTIVEIMNAIWSVVDETRIGCIEDQVDKENIKYYETLSSVLYSSYAQVRDLE